MVACTPTTEYFIQGPWWHEVLTFQLFFTQVDPWDPAPIVAITEETQATGIENVPWDRLQLTLDPQAAVEYAANVGSWDAEKRRHTRDILREFRHHFHSKRPR